STTATCSFTVSSQATFARVSAFAAQEEEGRVALSWETAAELGTAAFEVERRDPESGRFVRVAERAVPALGQLPGGHYRLVDPTAPRGRALTYRLVEGDQQGGRETLGPFEVEVSTGRPAGGGRARDFSARGKAVSERIARAALAPPAGRPKA